MARKKIVLVIVEGPSDEVALGMALSQVYDKDFIYVHIMHGDITARRGVSSKNIVAKLGNEVTAYAKSQHYKASDFKQIIHIVDTDGAYIPDDNIMEKENYLDIRYENDGIYTNNKASVMTRNQQKRDNLYRLRSCGIIWTIPYSLYYMSCNLDHVLYDKKNSTDKDKENDAYVLSKSIRARWNHSKNSFVNRHFLLLETIKDPGTILKRI